MMYLSDHLGQELQRAEGELRSAQNDLAQSYAADAQAAERLRGARRSKALWRRVLSVSTAEERDAQRHGIQARQQIIQANSAVQHTDAMVRQRAAGVSGENTLARGLSGLPDEWIMLRGYRNRRGETDHILVGPRGVWAIEVKLRRVRLTVNGDRWSYEKFDRYSNLVESGAAVDGGGRTWGRQVADVADDLGAWLSRHQHDAPVRTAVMLVHSGAQLGAIHQSTVDLIGTQPAQLLEAMWQHAATLSPDACADIVGLIRRDHEFHDQRRRR